MKGDGTFGSLIIEIRGDEAEMEGGRGGQLVFERSGRVKSEGTQDVKSECTQNVEREGTADVKSDCGRETG